MELNKLLKKVRKLNEEGKYEEVIELLTDDVLEENNHETLKEQKAYAYHLIGLRLYESKKYDESIEYFKKASLLDSTNSILYNNLGRAYFYKNDYETAINYYKKAIELDSNNKHPYNNIGIIYNKTNEYDKAIEYYQKAIDIDKEFSDPYNGIGNSYRNKKEYDTAMKYYLKAIEVDPNNSVPYYNIGRHYYNTKDYEKASTYIKDYLEKEEDKKSYYYTDFVEKLRELEEATRNNSEDIKKIVADIQKILFFEEPCITHYTGLGITQSLLLNAKNIFRISEGAYLNDTSEGRELFKYLDFHNKPIVQDETIALPFVKKPFIGSFVTEGKHDDLGLWRMYGKENGIEARGCAITIDRQKLLDAIKATMPDSSPGFNREELRFYRVAYRKYDNNFIVPDVNRNVQEELDNLMINLKKEVKAFNDDCLIKSEKGIKTTEATQQVTFLLNSIAYLFKTAEYQYEHELRLIVENYWKDKKIDQSFQIPKVYIELVNISPFVTKLTLGPKVDRSEEWAAAFHYQMDLDRKSLKDEDKLPLEIFISHLPYK